MKKETAQTKTLANLQDAALSHQHANAIRGGVYIMQPGDRILEVLNPETNYCRIQRADNLLLADVIMQ